MRRCRARKAVENNFLRVASASERTSPIEGANKVVSYMVEEETTMNVLHSICSEGTVTDAYKVRRDENGLRVLVP